MIRARLVCLVVAALLAGCQTDGVGLVSGPEPIVESNELNSLGRADMAAGNYGLAERHFREAVERNGDDGPSWIGLAAAYDNLGRFDLADRAYGQATRVEGETLTILNNTAYSYFLRGDRRRALTVVQRALRLYPGEPVLLNNLALISTGERPNRSAVP